MVDIADLISFNKMHNKLNKLIKYVLIEFKINWIAIFAISGILIN